MKLYKPQLQLVRRTHVDGPNEYFLHAVTFCDQSNCRPAGFTLDDSAVESEGILRVHLQIFKDPSLPDFNYLTPVAHTLSLGSIAFPDDEGLITAQAVVNTGDRNAEDTDSGERAKSSVSSSEADEDGRPIH